MRNYEFIRDKFLQKHSKIDNENYLDRYINFLINYKLNNNESDVYTEKHHILPRCTFPEYENESWNIVELEYTDHVNAHLYLFKSINIRSYQKPLNWMMKSYKNSEEISNAAKKGWEKLKNDTNNYEIWKDKRSKYMKNLSSDEQRRRANIFWENMSDDDYNKFCIEMQQYWTEERKLEKSNQMIEYYSNSANIEKKRIESKNTWDSMSIEYREKFSEKMKIINKDKNKRKDAGEKIKKLWKDDNYIEKMKNRKHRKGKKIKIIFPSGEEVVFETMRDIEKKYNFSSHLIRKYRDKDISIDEKDLKVNEQLSNCKIKTMTNG
jgi:hypothetical protein